MIVLSWSRRLSGSLINLQVEGYVCHLWQFISNSSALESCNQRLSVTGTRPIASRAHPDKQPDFSPAKRGPFPRSSCAEMYANATERNHARMMMTICRFLSRPVLLRRPNRMEQVVVSFIVHTLYSAILTFSLSISEYLCNSHGLGNFSNMY